MAYLFVVIVVGAIALLASWGLELVASRRQSDLRLSQVERAAHDRTEKLLTDFSERGLAPMKRREVWDKISWIWISSRVIALRSGRWSTIFWLALQGFACVAVSFKTLFVPDSHDLRLLLGGRDFLTFLVAVKHQPRRASKTPARAATET